MFKKIEIWVLYLVVILGLCFSIGFGILVRQELVGTVKLGYVSKWAVTLAEIPLVLKRIVINELVMEDRFPGQGGFDGEFLSLESYLLLSRYDGDLSESIVELVDLTSFEIVHTWNPHVDSINSLVSNSDPEFEFLTRDQNEQRFGISHPLLMPDGNLIFQSNSPLIKIDLCSELVWQNSDDVFHHSNELDGDGNIWVPTHMFPFAVDEKYVGNNPNEFLDDAITKVSQSGEVLFQKSVAEILIENGMKHLVFPAHGKFVFDPLHLNDIQPVLKDSLYWKRGDVFISLKHPSLIVLYRPSSNELVWSSDGFMSQQHDVDILNDHQISIFDNNGIHSIKGYVADDNNRVVIYDFETNAYSTYLMDSLVVQDVRTITNGRSQILDTGELLVEESNFGRSLFFNADGTLRWSHVNRASNMKVYPVNWSRILYTESDIAMVKSILKEGECEGEPI